MKMKRSIKLAEVMKIVVPVIAIVSLVLIMSSCGTGHVSCDAYGQNNVEYGDVSKDETS
jgi:hypothetical protein